MLHADFARLRFVTRADTLMTLGSGDATAARRSLQRRRASLRDG
jgi:hypothetical protein